MRFGFTLWRLVHRRNFHGPNPGSVVVIAIQDSKKGQKMALAYSSWSVGGLESDFPAIETVSAMPVETWKSILVRTKPWYASKSVVEGGQPGLQVQAGDVRVFGPAASTKHRACVSAAHASFAGDLREKLVVSPGTSSWGVVARSYITGRFQKGVIYRGADIVSDPEDALGNTSAEKWIRTPLSGI